MINELNETEWDKCPDGGLSHVVKRLNRDERRDSFRRISGVAFVVCFVLVVGALQWGKPLNTKATFGDMTCAEVAQVLRQYKLEMLDDETAERVKMHLAICPACQKAASELIAQSHIREAESILFAVGR